MPNLRPMIIRHLDELEHRLISGCPGFAKKPNEISEAINRVRTVVELMPRDALTAAAVVDQALAVVNDSPWRYQARDLLKAHLAEVSKVSTFNVAVAIPAGGNPSVEHSVAIAMEQHRGEKWNWYAIGADGADIAAVLLPDGRWVDREDDAWDDDWHGQYMAASELAVLVRCIA